MDKSFPFPLNYYDYLKKRCDTLFPYVEKELAHLKEKGMAGPFHHVEEYAIHADAYLKSETQAFINHSYGTLVERYGERRAQEMGPELLRSKEVEQAFHSFEMNYTTALNFELFGKKTFYVTPNLYEHLAQTSIDTDCELARLPFPSCMFVYDSPQAIDLLYQTADDTPVTYDGAISVFASELQENNERKILLYVFHADMNRYHYAVRRQLLLRETWTLEQALRTDWLKVNPESEKGAPFAVSDELFYTAGLGFFRSIVNTILYLGSNDPDLVQQLSPYRQLEERLSKAKSREKRKDIKSEMKRTSRLDYILVGRNIPRLMPENTGTSTGTEQREMHVRFVVRGHWRNQPYGPGNSLRRPVWIKPYYKGPEISDLIKNRPYIIS
ncbi:MAG TPA: hypothetical protein VI298_06105 [Geobacteraceae bacterium]